MMMTMLATTTAGLLLVVAEDNVPISPITVDEDDGGKHPADDPLGPERPRRPPVEMKARVGGSGGGHGPAVQFTDEQFGPF